MLKDLAIIIPAYKQTYLKAALDSIAAQTCKDFTLYIGDDCSPNELYAIIAPFEEKINLIYQRFDTNLGGKDLVAQWERCIDMTQGEKWLWLFSDDDVMAPKCVEEFYKKIHEKPQTGLVHFNISRLDDTTGQIHKLPEFPSHCTSKNYLDEKLKGRLISFVVEFVVRRDIFMNNGRFQNFDLAWGSDFISWVKFSDAAEGIDTCDNAKVYWRKSNENISPNNTSPILFRKIRSLTDNAKWLLEFTQNKGYGNKWFYTKHPLGEIRRNKHLLSKEQKKTLLNEYREKIRPNLMIQFIISFLKR